MHGDKHGQTGASLLEVMVALLVMSLGLLGIAGLQAASAKYRVNVQSYAAVGQLVSELSERVRINPEASGPGYDPAVSLAAASAGNPSLYVLEKTWAQQAKDALVIEKNCDATACTSQERANFDMQVWRRRVRDQLPQGAVIVQGDRMQGVNVALMWMDKEQLVDVVDAQTGNVTRSLQKAPVCQTGVDKAIVHNCCPAEASAPEGVRCLRMSFLP